MQAQAPSNTSIKLSSAKFSEIVMNVDDFYNLACRNGYFMPKRSCSAINELMILNIIQKQYWCPKYADIKLLPCVKAPTKSDLISKLQAFCAKKKLNIAWIDELHMPDKQWLVQVLATVAPEDEIFRKDYVAPPVRKRMRDIETIVLPKELLENMPVSTSKVKARRLKIMSEAFAAEKVQRLRDMRKHIEDEILEQEVRRDRYVQMKRAREKNVEEEKKLGGYN